MVATILQWSLKDGVAIGCPVKVLETLNKGAYNGQFALESATYSLTKSYHFN